MFNNNKKVSVLGGLEFGGLRFVGGGGGRSQRGSVAWYSFISEKTEGRRWSGRGYSTTSVQ